MARPHPPMGRRFQRFFLTFAISLCEKGGKKLPLTSKTEANKTRQDNARQDVRKCQDVPSREGALVGEVSFSSVLRTSTTTSAATSVGFFAGELSWAMRVAVFAGEFCCDVVVSSLSVLGFAGEPCSFSAMRWLLLAEVITMATS